MYIYISYVYNISILHILILHISYLKCNPRQQNTLTHIIGPKPLKTWLTINVFFPKLSQKKTGRIWVLVNDTHNQSLSPIIINYLHTSTSDWLHWLVSETSNLCMDRYRYRIIWYAGDIGFQVELSGRMRFAENHQVYKSKCRVKNCHCQCMGMVQNCVPQKMDGEILSN